ncbi:MULTISPECIES: hypothetical protein [unclassified Thiocapsa]|uniref:hypothetical protein n=1 Tax=unclassified Thiocapsa TaxID=2641286 RepID=UPI0035AE2A1B
MNKPAAREAGDADFDVLIACAFNYEAHATECNKLGRALIIIPASGRRIVRSQGFQP